MGIEEIRASGIIEQYALNLLSEEERQQAESYFTTYPELLVDLKEYLRAIELFAASKAIAPRAALEEQIIQKALQSNTTSAPTPKTASTNRAISSQGNRGWSYFLLIGLSLAFIGSSIFAFYQRSINKKQQQQLELLQNQCDSTLQQQAIALSTLQATFDPANKVLAMAATETYPETDVVFHTNPQKKLNYLQIKNLPTIGEDQAFQLWSLKEGEDPIPLDVFTANGELLIPVEYIDNTAAYAITIEPKGGSKSPTLSRLIGSVPLS